MKENEVKKIFGISEKDITLVKLLISNPKIPLKNLAKILGVTKQALAKRKRKLEENEIIKSYLFWNVLPRFELTKYFEIILESSKIEDEMEVIKKLDEEWTTAIIWKIPGKKTVIAGLILTERVKEFVKCFSKIKSVIDVKITPVLMRKFLGEKTKIGKISSEKILQTVEREIENILEKGKILAILYGFFPEEENVDICVIKSKIRGKEFYSYEKILDGIYFDYHIMTYKAFKEFATREPEWLASLKIKFTTNKAIERKINKILRYSRKNSTNLHI